MSSRNVIMKHLDGRFLRCPVCQYVIDRDHIAALRRNCKLAAHAKSVKEAVWNGPSLP